MQQIMANDPINELCQALAQLSLLESPVATEAQAVNRNSLNYPAERTGSILASCGQLSPVKILHFFKLLAAR